MNDSKATLSELKQLVADFTKEREWDQFYDAKSMSMNLSVEANELMELFTWAQASEVEHIVEKKREAIEFEKNEKEKKKTKQSINGKHLM